MLQNIFQIYFILAFCIIFLVKNGFSQESQFPKEKCETLLNKCFCYDLKSIAAIVCSNITDFIGFNQNLQSGAIFDVNALYEITFNHIKHLPAKTLEGLRIYRLILDDPDTIVDENVFEGVIQLNRFQVRQSSIKDIPDFSMTKNNIQIINIESSLLTSLKGKNLQDLPLIRKLSFFNNSISIIDPDVFKGTENIRILDLSNNLLTTIPPNLLDPMKNITKFVASNNNLLHVDNLFSVTHPQFIYLDFNNITDADSVLQYNMDKVDSFVLASNPIKKVSANSFNGKIPNVRFLYLDHCEIREFNVSHYKSLSILATLDLSYNLIEEVTNQVINLGLALELDLIGNQIRKFDAEIGPKLNRLYLSENKLQILNTTLQNTQIVEVQVARNQIQYLTNQDFKSVHDTTNLELQENKISRIDTDTFWPIRNDLHYLDLSYNLIQSLNRSVKNLSQLKLLNLTYNLIQTFENGDFTGLNELSELYLPHNQIKALGQLQYLEQLQYLVIAHNNIHVITPEQIPRTLRFMYLANNPLKCTCRLQPFLLWLNTSDSPATDVELCKQTDQVSSLHENSRCPWMCTCGCTNNENVYFMSVDCSSNNLTVVPQFLRKNIMQGDDNVTIISSYWRPLVMDQNIYLSLYIEDYVLGINMQNNSLESLDEVQLPPNLIQLYLSNNKLRTIPSSMLYNQQKLKQVLLSGNPWDCDCNALNFKKWLTSKYDVVRDINNTRCGISDKGKEKLNGEIIWTLSDLDICPADIGLIASVSFGVLILLLLAAAMKIMYTKYELNIKVFLYSHGCTFVKQEDLDNQKLFDAFLSFSDKDGDLASEIIAVIENKDECIRLCFHYRDFLPGEFIHKNIMYAVQNSKRTVVILSRNFLESEWCLLEFRAAHQQALEDKIHRLIVIKVGDLPKEIDPSIKIYLDNTTYLQWGDKYFWKKLLYILPNSNCNQNRILRNISESRSETELI